MLSLIVSCSCRQYSLGHYLKETQCVVDILALCLPPGCVVMMSPPNNNYHSDFTAQYIVTVCITVVDNIPSTPERHLISQSIDLESTWRDCQSI